MENNLFELTREEMKMKVDLVVGSDRIRTNLKKIVIGNFEQENQEDVIRFLDINRNTLLYGNPGTGKTAKEVYTERTCLFTNKNQRIFGNKGAVRISSIL
jgi:AAA+ superfamily predicted ATPase